MPGVFGLLGYMPPVPAAINPTVIYYNIPTDRVKSQTQLCNNNSAATVLCPYCLLLHLAFSQMSPLVIYIVTKPTIKHVVM